MDAQSHREYRNKNDTTKEIAHTRLTLTIAGVSHSPQRAPEYRGAV